MGREVSVGWFWQHQTPAIFSSHLLVPIPHRSVIRVLDCSLHQTADTRGALNQSEPLCNCFSKVGFLCNNHWSARTVEIKFVKWNTTTTLFLRDTSQYTFCYNMTSSVYDPGREDTIILENFMQELCRRDNEDNRGENRDPNRPVKIFTVEEIWLGLSPLCPTRAAELSLSLENVHFWMTTSIAGGMIPNQWNFHTSARRIVHILWWILWYLHVIVQYLWLFLYSWIKFCLYIQSFCQIYSSRIVFVEF